MADTLLLNGDAQPLSLIPLSTIHWQKAVKLFYSDQAEALEFYEDWFVHSPSIEFNVPAVMMIKEFLNVNFKRGVKYTRQNIFLRDDFKCQYCAKRFPSRQLTVDHVVPRASGGKTSWLNSATACNPCNIMKSDSTDGWTPLTEPYRPSYAELEHKALDKPVHVWHPAWEQFLPWDDELIIRKY